MNRMMCGLVCVLIMSAGCGKSEDPAQAAREAQQRKEFLKQLETNQKDLDALRQKQAELEKKRVEAEKKLADLQKQPATVKQGAGPSEEQIKRDLVGQEFFFTYESGFGGRKWVIQSEGITSASIKDRTTDSTAGTEEVDVALSLSGLSSSGETITISGNLILAYKRFDQGWRLQDVWPKAGGRPPFSGAGWGGKSFSWLIEKGR